MVFEGGRVFVQRIDVSQRDAAAFPIEMDGETIGDKYGLDVLQLILLWVTHAMNELKNSDSHQQQRYQNHL